MSTPRTLLLLVALGVCAPGAALGQAPQDSDLEADSAELVIARADSARAELVQPNGDKGNLGAYLVRAPFHIFGATVALGAAAGYALYQLFDETGVLGAAMDVNRALAASDVDVGVGTIGSRSLPALELRWEGLDPFFVEGAYSLRGYTRVRAGFELGDTVNGVELAAGRQDMNQLHFWGVGAQSTAAGRSDYQLVRRDAALSGWVRPARPLRLRFGGGVEEDALQRGHDTKRPDLQDVFPGLAASLAERDRFARAGAGFDLDLTRTDAQYQTGGVRLSADWQLFRGIEDTDARFQVGSADLQLLAPLDPMHALALRGLVAETWGEAGEGVPFYHMPALGSDRGLRGYRTWRFRDRAMASATAEWRYRVWYHPGDPSYRLDAAAFVDHGMVAPSLRELRRKDFLTTPGFGLRLTRPGGGVFGGYVAFGGDETSRWGLDLEVGF